MAVAWAVSFSKAQVIPHCNRLCHPPTTSGHPAVFHIKYKYNATQVLEIFTQETTNTIQTQIIPHCNHFSHPPNDVL